MAPLRTVACALAAVLLGGLPPGTAWAQAAAAPDAVGTTQPYRCSLEEEALLEQVERDTFRFFWATSPAATGLTPDRSPGSDVSSVAAIGFALTAYPVGVERGYVARAEAAARTLATLETLWRAPQGPAAEGVAGYNGLFYHFLDGQHAQRAWSSELSTIDTALLMAGVLTAQAYFDGPGQVEAGIRDLADRLYRRVDWAWAYSRKRKPLLSMGWSPETGYLESDWAGYNEGMILYLLALGSPTHPVEPQAWEEWTRSYRWDSPYGLPHVTFGPLFGHQYSHVWIDFRGIQDHYMQSKQIDYFENSVRATRANRAHCAANPKRFSGYGDLVWGLTASDGPFPSRPGVPDPGPFHGYWARGATPDASGDDGTIAPTAAGGSVPFAPEVAIPTLLHLRQAYGDRIYGEYGFKDAFNLSYPGGEGAPGGWFAEGYLGIDQGPILLMIENYRTGFLWNLLKKSPYLTGGLRRAGFSGGWLGPVMAEAGAEAAPPAHTADAEPARTVAPDAGPSPAPAAPGPAS